MLWHIKSNVSIPVLFTGTRTLFSLILNYNGLAWWRHQMETFSTLLALCARHSLVTGEFPTQRPVTRSFDVFFDLRLNKGLSKQMWGWWFDTPSGSLGRHCKGKVLIALTLCGEDISLVASPLRRQECCVWILDVCASTVSSVSEIACVTTHLTL